MLEQLTGTYGRAPATATRTELSPWVLAASGTKGYLPGGAQGDPAPWWTKGHYQQKQRGRWLPLGSRNTARRGRLTAHPEAWASLHRQTWPLSEKRPCPKTPSYHLPVTLFPVRAGERLLAARPEGLSSQHLPEPSARRSLRRRPSAGPARPSLRLREPASTRSGTKHNARGLLQRSELSQQAI